MFVKRAIAATALAATMSLALPAAPALADGAASTRNILLGIGAASYLIIQHNRKVHERYAEDARRQAELQSENRDAWAAYNSEKRAYANSLAEITDLKREVAYQHDVIVQQHHQLSMASRSGYTRPRSVAYVARPSQSHPTRRHSSAVRTAVARPHAGEVAMVSYGWGNL